MGAKKVKTIDLENVNHPGNNRPVDAAMYSAVRKAFLRILPKAGPGLTVDEARERMTPHLPSALFPDGAKAGWWMKAVQLDLEAKGLVVRTNVRPLHLRKSSGKP